MVRESTIILSTAAAKSTHLALTTSYKCLVGLSPFMPGIESGSMTVVHNDGFSFLYEVVSPVDGWSED